MPTIFTFNHIKFCVYFDDHGHAHCHVIKDDCHAKILIETMEVVEVQGFTKRDVVKLKLKIQEHKEELLKAWEEYNE